MPPRYSYWTIIAGGLPTAFRAAEREELLPTFTRLREKQPDAEMKWFARGRLWDSPADARADLETRRTREFDRGERPTRNRREGQREPARGRDWRPGGEHRDPRQKFKDAKKARNQHWRAEKFARKQGGDRPRDRSVERPRDARFDRPGDARVDRPREDRVDRPRENRFGPPRENRGEKPREQRPKFGQTRRPPSRPWNAPREGGSPKPDWKAGRERERNKPHGARPFQKRGFARSQGTEEPQGPPRPRGPNREPRPSESPEPTPPPRPAEPSIPSPPPERGRQSTRPHSPKREWKPARAGGARRWDKPRGPRR